MNIDFPKVGIGVILTDYIIPIIAFTYAIELMLKRIRLLGYGKINWAISFLISISTIYFLQGISLYITTASIFAISLFKIEGGQKFLIGIIAAVLYFMFIAPFLSNLG